MLAFWRQFAERTELELFDGAEEVVVERLFARLVDARLFLFLEVDEDGELVLEDLRGERDGVHGRDRPFVQTSRVSLS
jgi:hypothetical protein